MRVLYALSALYVVVLSAISAYWYLTNPIFMPYHGAALGSAWETLSSGHQVLHLGLMRVVGAGFLCVCLGVAVLAWRDLVNKDHWAGLLAGSLATITFGVGLYANLIIAGATGAVPPWHGTASALAAAVMLTGVAVTRMIGASRRV